ncbi:unnamed protein product [Ectocarpus fasciculatus]
MCETVERNDLSPVIGPAGTISVLLRTRGQWSTAKAAKHENVPPPLLPLPNPNERLAFFLTSCDITNNRNRSRLPPDSPSDSQRVDVSQQRRGGGWVVPSAVHRRHAGPGSLCRGCGCLVLRRRHHARHPLGQYHFR